MSRGIWSRHLLARWPSCCRWSRHQTAAAPGMCRGWSRHLGAPRHDWSRLCASQVYGRDSLLGVGEGQKRGEGLGAHPGPWHVLVPCFLGLGHSRRSIAGEPLPAVGVEFRRLGEGLVGGRSAMPCHGCFSLGPLGVQSNPSIFLYLTTP